MKIEILGQDYDAADDMTAALDLLAITKADEPYSEVSRQVFTVRPVTLNELPPDTDSGRINGMSGIADRFYELPVMKGGRWAEFKSPFGAVRFAKTLDLPHVRIDLDGIVVCHPNEVSPPK